MTSADSHPLLQEPKPKSSTLKKVVIAAIALSFVLGSIAGTVVNGRGVTSLIDTPSDDMDDTAPAPAPAPAQDPAPAPAQDPAQDPGSNGGCPPAGSTTEEACTAAGCTWVPGCEYKCVGSHDSCHALPGGKVESKAGGSAWEDSDGARGWTVFAGAVAAVLAAVAF